MAIENTLLHSNNYVPDAWMEWYTFPKGTCIPCQNTEEQMRMKKQNKPVIPMPGIGVSSTQP